MSAFMLHTIGCNYLQLLLFDSRKHGKSKHLCNSYSFKRHAKLTLNTTDKAANSTASDVKSLLEHHSGRFQVET